MINEYTRLWESFATEWSSWLWCSVRLDCPLITSFVNGQISVKTKILLFVQVSFESTVQNTNLKAYLSSLQNPLWESYYLVYSRDRMIIRSLACIKKNEAPQDAAERAMQAFAGKVNTQAALYSINHYSTQNSIASNTESWACKSSECL